MDARPPSGAPARTRHETRRERLLHVLENHRDRRLILLLAPAGFGKTTLAAAYARDSGAVVVWLALRIGDDDSRNLFRRMQLALEATCGPKAAPALSRGLHEGADGTGLARLLLLDLAHLPGRFLLVLDDYHLVQEAEEIHQAMDLLMRELPPTGQLLVATREAPPLSIQGLVFQERALVLGPEDLRFTPEETAELRRQLGGDASNDAQADGWVAGILLGGAPRQLGAADGSLIDTYVQREILSHLSAAERRWLETLALIDAITPERAARLLGPGPWPRRLEELAAHCAFLVPEDHGGYRLHALVREALTRRLRLSRPVRARRAWAAVRAMAEETGDIAAAVNACRELGDLDAAVALVTRAVHEAIQAGRWTPALGTLALLPESLRLERASLALAEAHALVQAGRPTPARQFAEAALEYGGRTGSVETQVRALVELANVARYTGDIEAAQDWITAASHLLDRANLPRRTHRLIEGRLLGLRGVCAAVAGQSDAARSDLESAERILLSEGTSRELAVVQFNLGTFCVGSGDYDSARAALAASTSHWRVLRDRGMLATAQLVLGILHMRVGDLNAAAASVARAIDAAQLAGALRTEGHALETLGALQRRYGRLSEATATLEAAVRMAEDIGEREALVRALTQRAEVAILQRQLPQARDLLGRAHTEAQRLESRIERAIVSRALGRLLLAESAGPAAVEAFTEALTDGATAWGPDERLSALYWLGTAHLEAGSIHLAESALREALQLAQEISGRAVLAVSAAEDGRLIAFGRELSMDPPAIAEIQRSSTQPRSWAGLSVARLPNIGEEPLRVEVRLFGSMRLHLRGVPVESGGKRDRARELLALLALHPDGMPASDIADVLYPEMDSDRAQHNLRMAVYLLRRLLGSKAAVTHATLSYALAPQIDLWADTRAFDAALRRTRGATAVQAQQAFEEALELYSGPLLANTGWAWVEPMRQSFAERAGEAAVSLAELLAPTDLGKSDSFAERALAIDPDNQAALRRLIQNAEARHDARAREAHLRRHPELAHRLGFRSRGLLRAI